MASGMSLRMARLMLNFYIVGGDLSPLCHFASGQSKTWAVGLTIV